MTTVQTITAPAKDWIAALTRLSPATAGRKPVPILESVLIDPSKGALFGYDYVTSATTELASAEGSGDPFLVPNRWLLDAIKSTAGKDKTRPATVSTDGEKLTFSLGGYELHTDAQKVSEYPEFPTVNPDAFVQIPAIELRAAFRAATVTASTDDTLPILNAIRVEIADGKLLFLSTDRYRLAATTALGEGEGSADLLVSVKAVKSLDRFLSSGTVRFGVQDRRIVFETAAATYTTLNVDGDYPKIRTLFPESSTASFEVDRAVLLESAKVARTMGELNSPCMVRMFDGGAEVTFAYGLFGPSRAPIASGENVAGETDEVRFAMNPTYFAEVLGAIPGEKVRISYSSLPKPFLFTPAGVEIDDADALKFLIMPVRMPA